MQVKTLEEQFKEIFGADVQINTKEGADCIANVLKLTESKPVNEANHE